MADDKIQHETKWLNLLKSYKISSVLCTGNHCDVSLESAKYINTSEFVQTDVTPEYRTILSGMCDADPDNLHEKIKQVALIPLSVLIISCNFAVIIFMAVNKHFHSPTYFLIGCLGMADSFVGFVSIGTLITHARESTLDTCLIRIGFSIASCVASLMFLVCIAIDRYIAITQTLLYKQIVTETKVGAVTILVWTFSLCFGFLPLMGWKRDEYRHYCSFLYVLPDNYVILLFVVGAFIPFFVMLVIYIKLYKNTKIHIKRIEAIENLHLDTRNNNGPLGISLRTWKSLKTLTVIIGCVFLTWIPLIITSIVQITLGHKACFLKDIIGTHLLILGYSNSFLNPLIYAFRSKDFREKVKKKFCRKHVCHPVEFISVYPISSGSNK